MPVIKAKPTTQIKSAQGIANKATNVFYNTLSDLKKANEILTGVINNELTQIKEHQLNINEADISIKSNEAVIKQLESFIPTK